VAARRWLVDMVQGTWWRGMMMVLPPTRVVIRLLATRLAEV
jgi:hypothetical protein